MDAVSTRLHGHPRSLEILQLPVLTDSYREGDHIETRSHIVDKKLTKPLLKQLLKRYHLPCSGNRENMIDRLREYAADPELWKGNYAAHPTHVRGRATGDRAKQGVAKRMRKEGYVLDSEVDHDVHLSKRAIESVAPARRTKQQIDVQVSRAEAYLARRHELAEKKVSLTVMAPSATNTTEPAVAATTDAATLSLTGAAGDRFAGLAGAGSVPLSGLPDTTYGPTTSSLAQLLMPFGRVEREVRQLRDRLERPLVCHVVLVPPPAGGLDGATLSPVGAVLGHPPPSPWFAPPPSRGASSATSFSTPVVSSRTRLLSPTLATPTSASCARAVDGASLAPAVSSNTDKVQGLTERAGSDKLHTLPRPGDGRGDPRAHASSTATVPQCTVHINGEAFTFDPRDVPDFPRGLHYSGPLFPALFQDWYESAHIVINGRGIAIRDWPLLLATRAGFKQNAWARHRSTWNNWRYIVEEYEALGSDPAVFWAKHSDGKGDRRSYTQVLDALKLERDRLTKARDGPAASDALRFFDGDLSAQPGPKARSRQGWFQYRRGSTYHTVTSTQEIATRWRALLAENEDVRARWEAMVAADRARPTTDDGAPTSTSTSTSSSSSSA